MKSLMEAIVMNMNMRDKIAGAIYGFAIGDAMGATTEFMTDKEIKRVYGKVTDIIGGGWLNLNPGDVTDDTQMSICVMNALMNTLDKNDPLGFKFLKQLRKEFIEWYESKPKDIGSQCQKAIQEMIYFQKLGATKDENALGNGSLMRAMPCAILDKPILNEYQGRLTHNNTVCSIIIDSYTRLIQDYLNGNNISVKTSFILDPSGHIRNTFNNSVYWSQKDSFKDAIIGAVNHGGDADTIAAITGSLAGAKFGYNNIPKKWIKQLNPEVKNILEKYKYFAFTYLQI